MNDEFEKPATDAALFKKVMGRMKDDQSAQVEICHQIYAELTLM